MKAKFSKYYSYKWFSNYFTHYLKFYLDGPHRSNDLDFLNFVNLKF